MNWLSASKDKENRTEADLRLDRLVGAARQAGPCRLSAESRDRVLNEALRHAGTEEPLPALFAPMRRLVIAGVLPVLLAAALLVGVTPRSQQVAHSGTASIEVSKQGDQVLFNIANGKRAHRVVRSSDPGQFDGANGVSVTDGAYSERLADNSDLVFYRID